MTTRVCMVLDNSLVHDARVRREGSALAAAGFDVVVLTRLEPGRPERERIDGFGVVRLGLRVPRRLEAAWGRLEARAADGHGRRAWIVARRLRRGVEYLTFWGRVHRAGRRAPADVWVAHDLQTLPIAHRLRSRLGGALLYDSHELFADRRHDPPLPRPARRVVRALEGRLIRRADRVLTVSPSCAERLRDRYGIDRPDLVLNVPPLPRALPAPGVRARLGIDPDARVVIYVGMLSRFRRLDVLIEAMARMDGAHLVLMGPAFGGYDRALLDLARRLGIGSRVRVVPPVAPDRVAAEASFADAGVIPLAPRDLNHRFALPNKLFECLAAGLPVVASDFPDMRHLIAEHGVGVTCDATDPGGLARALTGLLADDDARAAMSRNARTAAATRFNWEREGARLVEIVGGLAGAVAPDPGEPGGGEPRREPLGALTHGH